MKCPGGKLLTNSNVVSLFQACFRIGHYQTDRGKGMSGAAATGHASPYSGSLTCTACSLSVLPSETLQRLAWL